MKLQKGMSLMELLIMLMIFIVLIVLVNASASRTDLDFDFNRKLKIVGLNHQFGDKDVMLTLKNNAEVDLHEVKLLCQVEKYAENTYAYANLTLNVPAGQTRSIRTELKKTSPNLWAWMTGNWMLSLATSSEHNVPLFNAKKISCNVKALS